VRTGEKREGNSENMGSEKPREGSIPKRGVCVLGVGGWESKA
jgi:hypothetical protein